MDKRIRLINVLVSSIVTVSIILFCVALLKFFGQCAAWLGCAVSITSLFLYFWLFDEEYRTLIEESSERIYAILATLFLIFLLWFFAFGFCLSD